MEFYVFFNESPPSSTCGWITKDRVSFENKKKKKTCPIFSPSLSLADDEKTQRRYSVGVIRIKSKLLSFWRTLPADLRFRLTRYLPQIIHHKIFRPNVIALLIRVNNNISDLAFVCMAEKIRESAFDNWLIHFRHESFERNYKHVEEPRIRKLRVQFVSHLSTNTW